MSINGDEREAREWLERAINAWRPGGGDYRYSKKDDAKHRATILALLDRPVMPRPEDVPSALYRAMVRANDQEAIDILGLQAAYRVAYDHYTKRKPVKVETWVLVMPTGKMVAQGSREYVTEWHAHRDYIGSRIVHLVEADHD